jgi:FtsZ-binding cell division protein ZapB
MTQELETADAALGALEEKIGRAVAEINALRAERKRLEETNRSLAARLSEVDSGQSEEMKSRLRELEKERSEWLTEKRRLTRRVEDVLAKLEFLESESVPH